MDNNVYKIFIVILCMYIIDGDFFFIIKINNRENSMIKFDSIDFLMS